jgi:predicted enzyme related to lactoylglutathione lyase
MAKPKKKTKKPAPAPKQKTRKPKQKATAPKKVRAASKQPAPAMDLSFGHTALLPVLTGIRSVIYKVTDIDVAKRFYQSAVGKPPYFDQPFYVGFDVDGQEVGLDPDVSKVGPGPGGAVAYWKVIDIHAVFARLTNDLGGSPIEEPADVGGGIQVAVVGDPFGNLVGLIQMS